MKFAVSTKPLSDALGLGVVNANVSKFNSKSCIAQISASGNTLKINLEPTLIVTEIEFNGLNDDPAGNEVRFVDSLLFKQLVSTFEAAQTILEFVEGGVIIHSGKSKFTLANITDSDGRLNTPAANVSEDSFEPINFGSWKFISDRQRQFAGMAFQHPIYNRAYVTESGDVFVGDMDNSVFSYSEKGTLKETCLLGDTILNLICAVPETAKIAKLENGYQIKLKTDAFMLTSDFYPEHEEDEGVGSYNSDVIAELVQHTERYFKLPTKNIALTLKQADLLSTSSEACVSFGVSGNTAILKDDSGRIDSKIDITGTEGLEFNCTFKLKLLSQVLNDFPGDVAYIGPAEQEDEIVGIVAWDDDLTVVLAEVE